MRCAYYFKTNIGADYVQIKDFVITQTYTGGIPAQGNHDSYIHNELHHIGNVMDPSTTTAHVGILTYSGSTTTLIDSNYLHDIGRTNLTCGMAPCSPHDQNLYLEGANVTAVNNIIIPKLGWAMALKVGSNYVVTNNTFSGPAGNGRTGQIVIGDDLHTPLMGFIIRNNIFYNPLTSGVVTCGVALGGSNYLDHNIAFGSGVTGVMGTELCSGSTGLGTIVQSNNSIADPMFYNAPAFDFHIPFVSPATNAGVTIPGVTKDYDGVSRPQGPAFDIGAYEVLYP